MVNVRCIMFVTATLPLCRRKCSRRPVSFEIAARRVGSKHPDVLWQKQYSSHCGCLMRSKKVNGIWYLVCRKHEEWVMDCPMPPLPEDELIAAFLRLNYNLKNHPEILSYLAKGLITFRNRQMLWSMEAVELNKRICTTN